MTKEEILKSLGFNATQEQVTGGFIFNQMAYDFTLKAMESYASQEVTKVKHENELLNQINWAMSIGRWDEAARVKIESLQKDKEELNNHRIKIEAMEFEERNKVATLRALLERAKNEFLKIGPGIPIRHQDGWQQLLSDIDNATKTI